MHIYARGWFCVEPNLERFVPWLLIEKLLYSSIADENSSVEAANAVDVLYTAVPDTGGLLTSCTPQTPCY